MEVMVSLRGCDLDKLGAPADSCHCLTDAAAPALACRGRHVSGHCSQDGKALSTPAHPGSAARCEYGVAPLLCQTPLQKQGAPVVTLEGRGKPENLRVGSPSSEETSEPKG